MTASPLDPPSSMPPSHLRSLVAAIASMGFVNLTMGITFPLTAIILARQGVSPAMIGLNTAAQALPVFFVTPLVPRAIARLGPANLMIVAILTVALALLLMALYPNLYAWFPLRFLLGVGGTILWGSSEAWINALAPNERRGRIVGIYGAAAAAGFALGPATLAVMGTDVSPLFFGSAMLVLAALLTATADRKTNHFAGEAKGSAMWRLLLIAPAALLVNFFFAASEEALVTFFPLYSMKLGMGEDAAVSLLTISAIGAIFVQPLVGMIADKVNAYAFMTLLVVLSIAGYAALPFFLPGFIASAIAVFVVVGFANGLFTLGMVVVGQSFSGRELAGASAFTTAMWGTGALFGAPFSGWLMQVWDPHGLVLAVCLIYLIYLPFPLVAWLRSGTAAQAESSTS